MRPLAGIAISPGYAAGVAVVYDDEMDHRLEFPDREFRTEFLSAPLRAV